MVDLLDYLIEPHHDQVRRLPANTTQVYIMGRIAVRSNDRLGLHHRAGAIRSSELSFPAPRVSTGKHLVPE